MAVMPFLVWLVALIPWYAVIVKAAVDVGGVYDRIYIPYPVVHSDPTSSLVGPYNPKRHSYCPALQRDTIAMREEYIVMNTFLSENSDQKIFRRNSFLQNGWAFQDAENKLVTWTLLVGMSILLYFII